MSAGGAGQQSEQPAPRAELSPIPEGALCPDCGYDLRGLTGARCPECGFDLEVVRLQEPQIPWSRRKELGWFRGYWRTVWEVGRRPRRFCLEMVRPVSYRDSQTFRWLTFLHAYLPILIGSLLWQLFGPADGLASNELRLWLFFGLQVVAGLLLAALPGMGSYSFQSRRLPVEQQNRAIALSYYAWAPLAGTPAALPVLVAALIVARLCGPLDQVDLFITLGLAVGALGICLGALALSEFKLDRFSKCLHRQTAAVRLPRLLWLALLTPVLVLLVFAIPLSVFYVLVIWHSLS